MPDERYRTYNLPPRDGGQPDPQVLTAEEIEIAVATYRRLISEPNGSLEYGAAVDALRDATLRAQAARIGEMEAALSKERELPAVPDEVVEGLRLVLAGDPDASRIADSIANDYRTQAARLEEAVGAIDELLAAHLAAPFIPPGGPSGPEHMRLAKAWDRLSALRQAKEA